MKEISILNKQILDIINDKIDAPFSVNGISGEFDAAKEIEILILNEKIELAKKILNDYQRNYNFVSDAVNGNISELTTQLQKLKQ